MCLECRTATGPGVGSPWQVTGVESGVGDVPDWRLPVPMCLVPGIPLALFAFWQGV